MRKIAVAIAVVVGLAVASLAGYEPRKVEFNEGANQTLTTPVIEKPHYRKHPVIVGDSTQGRIRLQVLPVEAVATESGPSLNGEDVDVELPPRMHLRNKGGRDGSGLCVFTSIEHAAEWSNVDVLRGFRDWMTHQLGGGYPEKVDSMIAAYAKSRGLDKPDYVQHTGGDIEFLKTALAAGRYPCVTYAGHDGVHYNGRIAHMVNLVHLSDKYAVIHDNNFPGVWLWMGPDAFIQRWKEMGGGWAVVLLKAPPPPVPHNLKVSMRLTHPLPTESRDALMEEYKIWSQCPNGKCPIQPPADGLAHPIYEWRQHPDEKPNVVFYLYKDGLQIGGWRPSNFDRPWERPRGIWMDYDPITRKWGPERSCLPPIQPPVDSVNSIISGTNYGLDLERIEDEKVAYHLNGREVSKETAFQALGSSLTDDSRKLHLTAVGDQSLRNAFLDALKGIADVTKEKLLLQDYDPANWAVNDVKFAPGITLQLPIEKNGSSAVVWRSPGPMTAAELTEALRRPLLDYQPAKDALPNQPVPAPVNPNTPEVPLMLNQILAFLTTPSGMAILGVLSTLLMSYLHQNGTKLPILSMLLDAVLKQPQPVAPVAPADPVKSDPAVGPVLADLTALLKDIRDKLVPSVK